MSFLIPYTTCRSPIMTWLTSLLISKLNGNFTILIFLRSQEAQKIRPPMLYLIPNCWVWSTRENLFFYYKETCTIWFCVNILSILFIYEIENSHKPLQLIDSLLSLSFSCFLTSLIIPPIHQVNHIYRYLCLWDWFF